MQCLFEMSVAKWGLQLRFQLNLTDLRFVQEDAEEFPVAEAAAVQAAVF